MSPFQLLSVGDSHMLHEEWSPSFVDTCAEQSGGRLTMAGSIALPGKNTGQILLNISEAKRYEADAIVLMCGTNNVPLGVRGIASFSAVLPLLLRRLSMINSNIIVCTIPPWREGLASHLISAVNTQIRKHALKGYTLFDVHHVLTGGADEPLDTTDYADACHLSPQGALKLSVVLNEIVEQMRIARPRHEQAAKRGTSHTFSNPDL